MTTSNITVQTLNNQLVVDSRLIAESLGVTHKALLETIRKHQTTIEQAFGTFTVLNGESNGGRPEVFCYLNEEQANFVMSLSRNTPQVIRAKVNLVKSFSEAKKKLQGNATLDNDMVAALLSKLKDFDKLQSTILVADEYLKTREYSDTHLPGLNEITDAITDMRYQLPQVKIEFTAPEWVNAHAYNLTQRQKICFYKEIAASHRFFVGKKPTKTRCGKYLYDNSYEMIFRRVKFVAETMVDKEQKTIEICRDETISQFIIDTLVVTNDLNDKMSCGQLYDKYCQYIVNSGDYKISRTKFVKELQKILHSKTHGFNWTGVKKNMKLNSIQVNGLTGLMFKSQCDSN